MAQSVAISGSDGPLQCVHCGLPSGHQDYCCYGCELAAEINEEANRDHGHLRARLIFALLLTMSVMMLSLFLYAEDIYGTGNEPDLAWLRQFYRMASAAIATPVMVLCGVPLARRAWRRITAGELSMSALIASGSFAAYVLSLRGVWTGGDVYFESATAAVVLATLGRYLEASARSYAAGAVGAAGLSIQVDRSIQPGDRVSVQPEQTVPVDIVATSGRAEVNLAALTGEAEPIMIETGDEVLAGAVVIAGPLEGTALRTYRDSALERLEQLAKTLANKPGSLLRTADAFARVLTPLVWILALGTFVYWSVNQETIVGVIYALSVVLVACPCTYVIAAPVVHWLSLRRALLEGVVIRDASVLERLATVDAVAFDKTGTLTQPELQITKETYSIDRDEALALVAALETDTTHPAGRALLKLAADIKPAALRDKRVIPGEGIAASDEQDRNIQIGGRGKISLTREGVPLACFEVGEQLREEAQGAIDDLRANGINAQILSGDSSERAESIGANLGVPASGALSPQDKAARVSATTAMVGDGLNDAPALASVAASFAMGDGSGLARGMSQVVLQKQDLRLVPWTLELGRRSTALVRRLLIGATIYNVLFLTLAATGWLRPVWAGLSMLASSLLTVAFATSINHVKGVRS